MNDRHHPHASTRPAHLEDDVPRTWRSFALSVGLVALFPLTLFALAHLAVVAAALVGACAGLLAQPLYRGLQRRLDRYDSDRSDPDGAGRPTDALGPAATKD
ncbi:MULTISPECIES: hypothetical protein [Halorussus]|uniref:hypothetical protein n=1 Tax=Halorussus TaxID=1070314 RepID=UPI0020A035CC|nr:hypothetical protein [Halorussus vallis]USZ74499.1 hypothetical protein NGM07_13730 [Halorussus vallis]